MSGVFATTDDPVVDVVVVVVGVGRRPDEGSVLGPLLLLLFDSVVVFDCRRGRQRRESPPTPVDLGGRFDSELVFAFGSAKQSELRTE